MAPANASDPLGLAGEETPLHAMRRRDRAKDEAWIRTFLREAPLGTLASVHDGRPLVNSNLFVFDEEGRSILLHTARVGTTSARVAGRQAATFSAARMGRLLPAAVALEFSAEYASVVVSGVLEPVDDMAGKRRAMELFMAKYAPHLVPGRDYRAITDQELQRTGVHALRIESWSGKEKLADERFAGAYQYRIAGRAAPGGADSERAHEWRSAWTRLEAEIRQLYDGIRGLPVSPRLSGGELRRRLESEFDLFRPTRLDTLVSGVADMLRGGLVHVTHPRCFGLFNPSVREASILGDTLVAAFNPQLAVWSHAPAAHEIERHVLRQLARLLGFEPDRMHANFTTGGAEANLTAVLAALASSEPAWSRGGIAALTRKPVIYVTDQTHHSFVKIARITGLGTESLREVESDDAGVMLPESLRHQISADEAAGRRPLLVVGTAGSTATGSIDPLPALASIAAERGLWFHVDAAWGAAAVFSPRLRDVLSGIERADSVTWDAHKWLSVPMGAGMIFCRHPEALRRAFAAATAYMPSPVAGEEDPYLNTTQWSRRAIGIKLFMALAELGVEGYRSLIEHQAEMADSLCLLLEEAGWPVVTRSPLVVVCFTHPMARRGVVSIGSIVRSMQERGQVWVSEVRLKSEPAIRACITSFRTQPDDIAMLVQEAELALQRSLHMGEGS